MKSKVFASLAIVAAMGLLAGCSGGPGESPEPDKTSSAADSGLKALLPDSVVKAGKLVVGVTATYRPYEYMDDDGQTVIGANVDVLKAAADLWGIDLEWQNIQEYGSLLSGTQAGRYDASIIFEDTIERQKVVDLIDFYTAGMVFLGKAGSTADSSIACGKTVAVGTGNGPDLKSGEVNAKLCTDKGKSAINFQNFANTDAQLTALVSGRVDYMLTSESVAATFSQENKEYSARSAVLEPIPNGIAVAKDSKLTDALKTTLQKLADDGTVRKIFKKWGIETQAIDKVIVNFQG
jgi:polar amino acid transport system substrate-binding protein